MKKIALISDGWKRLITYAWVDGIMSRIHERKADIALYQYNCYGNWSKDKLYNTGEYNIYNLPKLTDFDGIVLDCSNIIDDGQREKTIQKLKDSGVPVVTIDYEVDGFYYVGADNGVSITELIHHLYEEHGCRRFAFAGGPEDAFSNRGREQAYRRCMEEFGLRIEDNPVYFGDYDFQTGVNYMKMYGREGLPLPDAFICANDNIAAGICAQAEKQGCRVPEDFRVTGFDNLDKALYFRPQITTAGLDRSLIGATCVDILMSLWEGREVPQHTFTPVECIYGESCGCANNQMVDYREYIKGLIVGGIVKDSDDTLLTELEAEMAKYSQFEKIFDCIVDYFSKLQCDGLYIVVDKKLFGADAETVFPTEGYDWEELVVASGFEDGRRTEITDTEELYRHLEEKGSGSAYMFTPIHFKQQAVGYMIMKNSRFLFDNPYYYDIHCTMVKALETQFKQNQLERAVEKLQELYNHDPLTGIYNRIAYMELIRPAFLRYRGEGVICALVFVDADDFKSINDTYGHEFGDQVLIKIAATLREECPEKGYVCRYGGDEFFAFFPYATQEMTDAYVGRVMERLGAEDISVSMGIRLTDATLDATLDEYLSMADQNMYEQKQAHKRRRNQ
ncbi:MAG: substrate-binding domain-containing protein [Muribaculaceae bacterium]|nr:substrate-binding domain-containing protein [Roseburia sp.]MCM1429933.1 substrate-binding domain-containing protein [Muribaculaceae bacterium]MCM1493040.1 substrate-binding domain-containing protein [Muribaculaceae bacterium]